MAIEDKYTRELTNMPGSEIKATDMIPIDREGLSESQMIYIGDVACGRQYLIPVRDWDFRATRHKLIENVPSDIIFVDGVTVFDDNGDCYAGNSIFDINIAGEYAHRLYKRENFTQGYYFQPASFGIRVHSEVVNNVKNFRLMHNYPAVLDGFINTFNIFMSNQYNVVAGIGTYQCTLSYGSVGEYVIRPGCIIVDENELFFPKGTYVEEIQTTAGGATVLTMSKKSLDSTTGSGFITSFLIPNRSFTDSLKYGLECNASTLINGEGLGTWIPEVGQLSKFASTSVLRAYIKVILPFKTI